MGKTQKDIMRFPPYRSAASSMEGFTVSALSTSLIRIARRVPF
jgi:hypothetical protein